MTITDSAHVAAAAVLRHTFQHPNHRPEAAGLVRDLADYDTAFGVDADQLKPHGATMSTQPGTPETLKQIRTWPPP